MSRKSVYRFVAALIALATPSHLFAASHISFPIERENDQLCITFPDSGIRWLITITPDKKNVSTYGQRLCIEKDSEIQLSEKHETHTIKAVIQEDRIGLEVTSVVDLRSFGGELTSESYFISLSAHL